MPKAMKEQLLVVFGVIADKLPFVFVTSHRRGQNSDCCSPLGPMGTNLDCLTLFVCVCMRAWSNVGDSVLFFFFFVNLFAEICVE